jgi:leader peptidase (prepilin peptidase)/N-methyltransferase
MQQGGYQDGNVAALLAASQLSWVIAAWVGACVGSFLNVVIYRMPLGMSVNRPRRSFCPLCQTPIAWWNNLPLVSWLLLRGRCASCRGAIPFRYWLVECLTAALFAWAWAMLSPAAAGIMALFFALLVVISWIDIDHMIISLRITTWASVLAMALTAWLSPSWPWASEPSMLALAWGWLLGFFGLWGVVLLGKLAFGRRKVHFDQAVDWHLQEAQTPEESLSLVLDGESVPWWDMFFRRSDELRLWTTELWCDGEAVMPGLLRVRETALTLPDGSERSIEALVSLRGKASEVVIPREAMGMGDPHLLGMIGAFLGGTALIFVVMAAACFALLWALIGRVGLGRPLPFGPFLACGAIAWVLGGWRLWDAYWNWATVGVFP